MIKNIILGKESLLTKNLVKKKNFFSFSARDINSLNEILDKINKYKKVNLILNNFYPSDKIKNLTKIDYVKFYDQSLLFNAKLFTEIDPKKINRIIYSSSSSVYNSVKTDYKFLDSGNRALYSSTKVAVENLVYNFASSHNISFVILRIFNMYSQIDDKFSIISKIYNSINTKEPLLIQNRGEGIRDFIHVDDVSKIIINIINKKNLNSKTFDIGTGKGIKVKDLINYIGRDKIKIHYKKGTLNETGSSIANYTLEKKFNFISLEKFFKNKTINKSNKIEFFKNKKKNILQEIVDDYVIYGAGNAGKQVFQGLSAENKKVIYFVDDNKLLVNKFLFVIKILSFIDFNSLMTAKIFKNLIIAIPTIKEKRLKKLKNIFYPHIENLFVLPLKKQLQTNLISLSDLDSFDTEFLLDRKVRAVNYSVFNTSLKNKNVLITGAAGSIGSQLVRQLLNTTCSKIIGVDNCEITLFNLINETKKFKRIKLYLADIKNKDYLNLIIKDEKIDIIFHAAAFKHVNILENNILSAVRNNIFGTKIVLDCAFENRTDFVLISTDKAVKPSNILGMTKRIAELICLEYNVNFSSINKFRVVRFGNVFGSAGSAIPTFINQLNNRSPATITNKDATRYFMTSNEACYLILASLHIKKPSNILILEMGKPIKIIDIIKKLIILKKKYDPNFETKIIEIGLKKGEKLHENLSINKLIKTNVRGINTAKEPIYVSKKLHGLISDLKNELDPDKIKIIMKEFLKSEIADVRQSEIADVRRY